MAFFAFFVDLALMAVFLGSSPLYSKYSRTLKIFNEKPQSFHRSIVLMTFATNTHVTLDMHLSYAVVI